MNLAFTITIDLIDGKLTTWCQQKDKLSPEEERKFDDLRRRIDKIIREDAKQIEMIT